MAQEELTTDLGSLQRLLFTVQPGVCFLRLNIYFPNRRRSLMLFKTLPLLLPSYNAEHPTGSGTFLGSLIKEGKL